MTQTTTTVVEGTGYHKVLGHRQIQMIALGGAIGVGLFLGIARPLAAAGPALLLSYLAVSVLVYLLMRAVGELVLQAPDTGSFVNWGILYVSRLWGAYTGWIYVTLAVLAASAELTAIAVYCQRWWPTVPGWVFSMIALSIIAGTNLASARMFGYIEFGAAGVKVVTIVIFLVAGLLIVFFGSLLGIDSQASVANLWNDGGFLPNGWLPVLLVIQGVVFSFSAVEVVGITAGEAKNPTHSIPKAVQTVMLRIGLFYLGSIVVLTMLNPWRTYTTIESPFVTALSSLGLPALPDVMNFVVITAAISGVNVTMYASVRLLQSLAANGLGPQGVHRVDRRGVPTPSLLTIAAVIGALVLLLTFVAGASSAFEIILGACAAFILFGWISILVSHIGYRRRVQNGLLHDVEFRQPGGATTSTLVVAAFVGMFLWMTFDLSNPHWYYSLIAALVLLGGATLLYRYFAAKYPQQGVQTLPTEPAAERGRLG
jgi:L-asparagine permease